MFGFFDACDLDHPIFDYTVEDYEDDINATSHHVHDGDHGYEVALRVAKTCRARHRHRGHLHFVLIAPLGLERALSAVTVIGGSTQVACTTSFTSVLAMIVRLTEVIGPYFPESRVVDLINDDLELLHAIEVFAESYEFQCRMRGGLMSRRIAMDTYMTYTYRPRIRASIREDRLLRRENPLASRNRDVDRLVDDIDRMLHALELGGQTSDDVLASVDV